MNETEFICFHSKEQYGSESAAMVYSPVMGAQVCTVCGHWSRIGSDESLAAQQHQTDAPQTGTNKQ